LNLCEALPAAGTEHFRTPVSTGVKIIESLRGFTTGYAIPTFVIDAPGGGGKVPIGPEYVISMNKEATVIRNFEGKVYVYPEPQQGLHAEKTRKAALSDRVHRSKN
jgi:lysine 2,3-aminomutase